MTLTLPIPTSAERSRILAVDAMRRRALERLYERRATLENLIDSLEDYQRLQNTRQTSKIEFIAERKCS
jgi:hypothetical protein